MLIIGVAGGSGSGKSTFARRLMRDLSESDIQVLTHDSYYRPLDHLSLEERQKVNFDHPDALDSHRMIRDIKALQRGFPIDVPQYDFNLHTTTEQVQRIYPPVVLIVEGILVLAEPRLRELMDMKIFIDTDDDDRLMRRIQRDIHERGRDLESVIHQYQLTVKPMHLEFVEPSKRWANVIVPRGGKNKVCLDLVRRKIHMAVNRAYDESMVDD